MHPDHVGFRFGGCTFPVGRIRTSIEPMLQGIDSLIFDLGGVIINLDTRRTVEAFAHLASRRPEVVEPLMALPFFEDYEKGMMPDSEFRENVRGVLGVHASDQQIDAAWNAMLLDVPHSRLALLRALAPRYRLFLLSNTNAIHLHCFNTRVLAGSGLKTLAPLFTRTYYSHLLGMRKPDDEIFEFVLRDTGAAAAATLFLDDNADNLRGAQRCGIAAFHVRKPETIFELFNYSDTGA